VIRPARPVERTSDVMPAPDRRVREHEVESQVDDLLARLTDQVRRAKEAQPGDGSFLAWPPWSMDTGLTAAQEEFVEHWSPQKVLDHARAVRELMNVLQRWVRTHHDDELSDAISVFATSQAR
jgi:hypothetical protein